MTQDSGSMGVWRADKIRVGRRVYKKLKDAELNRPRLVVIIGNDGNELIYSGGREVFVGGDGRRGDRYISGRAVVGGEAQQRQRLNQRLEAKKSHSLLGLPRPGGGRRCTPVVEETE